jgi:hypothetical protein
MPGQGAAVQFDPSSSYSPASSGAAFDPNAGYAPAQQTAAQTTQETGVLAGVKRNTVGMVQGLYHAFTDPVSDSERAALKKKVDDANSQLGANVPHELYTDPTPAQLAYHRIVDAPAQELELKGQNERVAAKDLMSRGDTFNGANQYLSGVTDTVLSKVPMLGPAINSIAQRFESGDHSGAAVDVAALMTPDIANGIKQFQPIRTAMPGGTPERLYESSLKPSTTIPAPKRAAIVQTGLENQIPVSASGAEKLSNLVDDLNSKIKQTIDQGNQQGATVNKFSVASRLGNTAQKFATQVTPVSDLSNISEAGNEFLATHPNEIPASDAQALKIGTYQQLKSAAYGTLKSSTIEAQKALARGIKEELVTQFPELKDLNAQESQLLNLDPVLERAVNRISNHQMIGIGTPIAAGAAKAVTGSTGIGAVAGLMKAVFDDPMIKSKIAIALASKGVRPMSIPTRFATYSTALGNAASGAANADQERQQ